MKGRSWNANNFECLNCAELGYSNVPRKQIGAFLFFRYLTLLQLNAFENLHSCIYLIASGSDKDNATLISRLTFTIAHHKAPIFCTI